MVSGKPPRHSRTKAEPVTIDLDAKDVKTLAPGATEPDKQEPVVAADQPSLDIPASSPIEPQPNVDIGDEPKDEQKNEKPSFEEQLSEASDKPDAPQTLEREPQENDVKEAAQQEEPVFSPPPPPQPASTEARQGSSGFIAAGIFGGLIALLAAGSMQYAGYLPPFSSAANQDAENALSAEIASLKTQLSALQQQAQSAPAADTSALDARLAALENAVPAASGESADVSGLADKIASLEGTVSSLQSERSAQETATADLTRRLNDAEAKLNEPRDDIEVARAIASAGLKAAVDRGGPFLTELDTLAGVATDDPSVAALKPFATTGVPSRAELLRTFPDVANSMLATLNQPDPNQSIVERLTESAYSLVKVRPVGNIEGETPEAVIARMEDKMRNGDLQGAALEWNALPDAAKTVSTAYKQSLDARIEVEKLVGDSLSRAINSSGQKG
ncbi:hypothetical protein HGO37_16615 [Rhizobium sp. CG4]|uniref:COG4223 family protein n=1 Tax=Rhizobium sp. CG4 TaxID=2726075 RepID=UPI002034554A|nr:mitofilin family membrane protein [Rhizobium sp. CG4]MCM2457019.1 hypothetical protein [Rhizobium sp. CG4]